MIAKAKKNGNLILTTDYHRIFNKRLVIVEGVSRSGTSILGKVVGSLKNVIFSYEPRIIRFLPTLVKSRLIDFEPASNLLKGIFFEDYYLQLIQGRNLNIRKSENSYSGNYEHLKALEERWLKYKRRKHVLDDIYKGKFIFALKMSELSPLLLVLEKIFEGMKLIYIIRNGNAVISSSLERGWYSDEYLNNYMNEWAWQGQPKVPWFIPACDIEKFQNWNRETRIAYIWRTLVKMQRDYAKGKKNCLELRYEDLVLNPEGVTTLCEKFLGSRRTKITSKHILAIKRHKLTEHPDLVRKIDREEAPLFEKCMRELNYL